MGKSWYDRIDLLTASLGLAKTAADLLTKDLRVFVRQAYDGDQETISHLRDDQIQKCAADFLHKINTDSAHPYPLPEAISQDKLQEVFTRIIKRQCINLRHMRNKRPKIKITMRQKSTKRQPDPHDFHPASLRQKAEQQNWLDVSSDDDDSSDSDDATDADDGDGSGRSDDFDNFHGMLDPGDLSADDDFSMSATQLSASPEPVRSHSRRLDGKSASSTAGKRKAVDTEEGANKRPRAESGSTNKTTPPTKVSKADEEWAREIKRYLKNCKYSLERDLTNLRFEAAQQILSQPLGRGGDPMPYLAIVSREARFNLRHYEDNARHTVYILKLSVYAVDETRPLHSKFLITRKGFTHAAAKEAFLGWHFDQPDDPVAIVGIPVHTPASETGGSFLSLKTGTASVAGPQPATPVDATASNTYATWTSKFGGGYHMQGKVSEPTDTVPGRQTVSHSKEQGPRQAVLDTIGIGNPLTSNSLHLATTPSHTSDKKVLSDAGCGTGSCPTAINGTDKGTISMTGMITLLSDPEVAKPRVSQHHLHLAGVSNGSNRFSTTALAFTIPRLGVSSGPVAASTQAIQSIPVDQMSKETKIDLTIEPQASTPPTPQAQPYMDAIVTKIAEMIANHRQPTRCSQTQTSPLPYTSSAGSQTESPFSPLATVSMSSESIPPPSRSSSTTPHPVQSQPTHPLNNTKKPPLHVSISDVRPHVLFWHKKQREVARCRQKAVIANDEDAREDYRTYEDEIAFVSVILETLFGSRDVVSEA